MSYSIYTPAWERLQQDEKYKQLQAQYDAWSERPTVASQDESKQDWLDYERITGAQAKLENAVGHGGFGGCAGLLTRTTKIEGIRKWHKDTTGACCGFDLTHEELGQFLYEYRVWLRAVMWTLEAAQLATVTNMTVPAGLSGFTNPFQASVYCYKTLCQAYRLGEGCWVA